MGDFKGSFYHGIPHLPAVVRKLMEKLKITLLNTALPNQYIPVDDQ